MIVAIAADGVLDRQSVSHRPIDVQRGTPDLRPRDGKCAPESAWPPPAAAPRMCGWYQNVPGSQDGQAAQVRVATSHVLPGEQVRLNKAYRAIYVERDTGEVELIEVLEVNKHEY